ncbi:MAG: hypothetical protein HQ564_02690 [Candidatus Saganbacteria bacterium]|nr:hypothetical protein [Candidatus Saganbacteria bacterium]
MAGSGIHLMFGRHIPRHFGRYKAKLVEIKKELPPQVTPLFIAEIGSVDPLPSMMDMENTERCVRSQKMNRKMEEELTTFVSSGIQSMAEGVVSLSQRGLSEGELNELSKVDIAFAQSLFSVFSGCCFSLENPSANSIFMNYIASAFHGVFDESWQGIIPFDFATMIDIAKEWYRYTYYHCEERDELLGDNIRALNNGGHEVIISRGIAHLGYYQRRFPGANIYPIGEAYFTERFISDNLKPDEVSKIHYAQILKELAYEFIAKNSSISDRRALRAASNLPDDLDKLEEFFERYNIEMAEGEALSSATRDMTHELLFH